jgi:hypothetical protein
VYKLYILYFISHRESLGVIGVIFRDRENGGGGNCGIKCNEGITVESGGNGRGKGGWNGS